MENQSVEMDNSHFDDLKNNLMGMKEEKSSSPKKESVHEAAQQPEKTISDEKRASSQSKKYTFKKGETAFEIDDDAEIEFMADKKPTKLTLRELTDRAAGDIAIKKRMHDLAEEKKRVQSTFKKFTDIAKDDALGALEYISQKAQETDSEFEYNKYVQKLAEQAEKLGSMTEPERKALELEKKLSKAEQDLSQKEREKAAVLRKQEILSDYPEIGDSQFSQMVEQVLENETLMEGIEDEKGILDKVEELIEETMLQKDIIDVIEEINPDHAEDSDLIFSLSAQIRQNPDLDEEDVRDILRELIGPKEKRAPARSEDREMAIRTLSKKQRQSVPADQLKAQGASDFQLLQMKLLEKQERTNKTPIYKR